MRGGIAEAMVTASLSLAVGFAVFGVGAAIVEVPYPNGRSSTPVPNGCQEVPIAPLADSGIGGRAQLCVDDEGVSVTVEAENVTVGDTYELWFSYDDLFRPEAGDSAGGQTDGPPSSPARRLAGSRAPTRELSVTAKISRLRPAVGSEIGLQLFGADLPSLDSLLGPTGSPVAWATFHLDR
jgi:hypothetical protein